MHPTKTSKLLALVAALVSHAAFVETSHAQSRPARSATRPPAPVAGRQRATFYQRMARVREGMTEAAVRSIVGPPDFVLQRGHAALQQGANLTTAWCYGATAQGDLPTHGTIAFDRSRRVYTMSGTRAPRPSILAMTDDALRSHLNNIAAIGAIDAARFDPAPLVRAVNALQPLGRDAALDVIDEYLRVHNGALAALDESVFLLLRALFVPSSPHRAHPPAALGAPSVMPPTNPDDLPAFPLAIADDVPFVLVTGYTLGGVPQPAEQHMPWYRASATIRPRPLAPNSATALATFAATAGGRHFFAAEPSGRAMLTSQLQRYNASLATRSP
ncbi:MAG: hypothetical protein JNK05_03110 [Myxococcales bacterium]|nr:hypothetical protein [Myxococcales bacterium]